MEERKQQFYGFVIILLIIGFLNYFRRINAGMKLSKTGKIIHILTMLVFVVGTMFVLYYTELNNILSFCIGLFMANFSGNSLYILSFALKFGLIILFFSLLYYFVYFIFIIFINFISCF